MGLHFFLLSQALPPCLWETLGDFFQEEGSSSTPLLSAACHCRQLHSFSLLTSSFEILPAGERHPLFPFTRTTGLLPSSLGWLGKRPGRQAHSGTPQTYKGWGPQNTCLPIFPQALHTQLPQSCAANRLHTQLYLFLWSQLWPDTSPKCTHDTSKIVNISCTLLGFPGASRVSSIFTRLRQSQFLLCLYFSPVPSRITPLLPSYHQAGCSGFFGYVVSHTYLISSCRLSGGRI